MTKKRNIEEKEEGSIPLKEFCKVKNKIEENKGNRGTARGLKGCPLNQQRKTKNGSDSGARLTILTVTCSTQVLS